jgi:hypothetical protein
MTTAATSTPVSMASNAAFQAWYNEQITQLTAVGLTQTADTGQIGATAAIPAANTAAGYTIWRFNDTLQSTAPIFIKLEFGAGTTPAQDPQMWITTGTSTNGAGTLSGTTTRVAVLSGSAPSSTTANFTSRWCYNATDGILWMVFKQQTTLGGSLGAFIVARGNTTAGASAGDAAILLTNSITASANTSTAGQMQCWSYASSANFPTAQSTNVNGGWLATSGSTGAPFSLTGTLVGSTAYITPANYMNPNISFHALIGAALLTELALGSTCVSAIVGSTTHTFIQVGQCFGADSLGNISVPGNGAGLILPWE